MNFLELPGKDSRLVINTAQIVAVMPAQPHGTELYCTDAGGGAFVTTLSYEEVLRRLARVETVRRYTAEN